MDSNSKQYRYTYSAWAFASESRFNLGRHELNCRNKKRYRPDIGGNHDEKVKGEYDERSSGLKGESSDVVSKEDGFPSPAVETPTIVEEDDEGVSKKFSSFAVKFTGILRRAAKHNDG